MDDPSGVELRSKILARLDRERKPADGTATGPGPWARLTIRVAESGYLAQPMPDSGALPRFKLIPGADFPGATYSAKFFATVGFSLR
jgi:hypothetical protein